MEWHWTGERGCTRTVGVGYDVEKCPKVEGRCLIYDVLMYVTKVCQSFCVGYDDKVVMYPKESDDLSLAWDVIDVTLLSPISGINFHLLMSISHSFRRWTIRDV